jgi:NADH-quinone oxidoreductase subunit J
MLEQLFLIICMALTAMTAFMVVFSRHAIHSAMWMVASSSALAVLFLLLKLQFLAVLQIIVYAGAIMMFIVYAVMMLNLRYQTGVTSLPRLKSVSLVLIGMLVLAILGLLGSGEVVTAPKGAATLQAFQEYGEVRVLAQAIFSDYLLPFELVSVLLTAGVVGAVALAKQTRTKE